MSSLVRLPRECEKDGGHLWKTMCGTTVCWSVWGGETLQHGSPQNGIFEHVYTIFLSSNLISEFLWASISMNKKWWTYQDSYLLILTILVDFEEIKSCLEFAHKQSTQRPMTSLKVVDPFNSYTLHLPTF